MKLIKLTEKQKEKILELFNGGQTLRDISKIFGISTTTLSIKLHGMNENLRQQKRSNLREMQISQCCKLYISGKSARQISKIYNTSGTYILNLLRKNNIKIRDGIRIIGDTCICKICGKEKQIFEMKKNKEAKCGISSVCIQCHNEREKKHDCKFSKYGITYDKYKEILIEQDGKCAICGSGIGGNRNMTEKRLFIDHNHITGKVRGLLCSKCNVGIGNLRDSPELLEKAAQYLRSYQ